MRPAAYVLPDGTPRCVTTFHYGTLGPVWHNGPNPDDMRGWLGMCGRPADLGNVCDECRQDYADNYPHYGPHRRWLTPPTDDPDATAFRTVFPRDHTDHGSAVFAAYGEDAFYDDLADDLGYPDVEGPDGWAVDSGFYYDPGVGTWRDDDGNPADIFTALYHAHEGATHAR